MMDDLHSMSLSDELLLSFALGEEPLPEEASVHLEQCAICQERLARYRETHTFLVSHLYRHSCPDAAQLSFYCANLLPADERMHIANHLLECPLCMAEVTEARAFLNDELLPEPMSVSLPRKVQRIFATLVRQQAQFVVRGERGEREKHGEHDAGRWPRQYRAGTVDLSLHLSRASNGDYVLLGIMTGIDAEENIDAFAGIQTNLYPAPEFIAHENDREPVAFLSTEVDDIGNFVFSPVPLGHYVMNICLPEAELVIEDITIGQTKPL